LSLSLAFFHHVAYARIYCSIQLPYYLSYLSRHNLDFGTEFNPRHNPTLLFRLFVTDAIEIHISVCCSSQSSIGFGVKVIKRIIQVSFSSPGYLKASSRLYKHKEKKKKK